MSASGPTQTCPRCATVLPVPAAFCGVCGWQFSAPAAPAPAPVASVSQPPVPSGYALPGQPGAPGFPPGAGAPSPRKGLSRTLLAVIVLAGVLTVAIPGFLVFGGHGGSLLTDRHGLPGNVPLPNGVTFKLTDNVGTGGSLHEWDWTVASPNDPTTVSHFYQSNLPGNGWSKVNVDPQGGGEYLVIGCQSNQSVVVTTNNTTLEVGGGQAPATTITAPSGGATLQIVLSSDSGEVAANCSY